MSKHLLLGFFACISYVFGQAQTENVHALPSAFDDNTTFSTPKFGFTVDVSDNGDVVVVGSPDYEDTDFVTGLDFGAMTIYRKDGSGAFQEEQFTSPIDTATFVFNRFAAAVALNADGTKLAVGSPLYCDGDAAMGCDGPANVGRVYVFNYNGASWDLEQEFSPITTVTNFNTGFSLDISDDGNTIVAGAPGWSNFSANPVFTIGGGAAFVYTNNGGTWQEEQLLFSSDVANSDRFGHDVAISGDGNTIISGATDDGGGATEKMGSAYIFRKSGGVWTEEQKLTASDGAGGHEFGISVDLSDDGNTAIVGAPGNNKAYIFTFSSAWSESTTLTETGTVQFGFSVDLTGDGAIAAVGDPGFSSNIGRGFLFSSSPIAFTTTTDLIPGSSTADSNFAYDIAVSDGGYETVLGAPGTTSSGNPTGEASTFTFQRPILPVELVEFTAEYVGNSRVELDWTTATEENNDGFSIERSMDGTNWQEVGFVAGTGNSAQGQAYSYMDIVSGEGRYFYRLKQVDFDGGFTYSELREVLVREDRRVVLVANPVRNQLQLTIDAVNTYKGGVASIFDMQGRGVEQVNVDGASIDISSLASGTYVLVLESTNGSATVKFVKQ
ncbi:MAG: T9SS type A sorting domain-containing protein [Saprospiraceae bacterium]|nr:T9SS type A sorting domain-containing protein [Saprospiraceae bacterium]